MTDFRIHGHIYLTLKSNDVCIELMELSILPSNDTVKSLSEIIENSANKMFKLQTHH